MPRIDETGPFSLEALRTLPLPQLFEHDAGLLRSQLVAWFEAETGRTLYPAQIETYLIDMLAYVWSLLNEAGEIAHLQRYAALAEGAWLDAIGASLQMPRLAASSAMTTVRFTLASAMPGQVIIPAGTRVSAGSEETTFLTQAVALIAAGSLSVDALVVAQAAGIDANGLLAGQVNALLDPVAGITSAANLTVSDGGADAEGDDAYRLRLCNALDKANRCGTRRSYREQVFAVSIAIIDVAAVRPQPCYIDIYILTAAGAAGAELNAAALAALDAETARPMGDLITMKQAVARTYTLGMAIVASRDVSAEALATAQAVVAGWQRRFAVRLAPEVIRTAVKAISGVINVEVTGLVYTQCAEYEYPVCLSIGQPVLTLVSP